MDDDLLPNYEQELTLLRKSLAGFAQRHPRIAARLGVSGDRCDDPHVERMLQSFALLAAKIDRRLGDNYSEFSESLVGTTYPQYLRPIPACAIARFDVSGLYERVTGPSKLARGTLLTGKAEDYRFRTVYDVTLAPIAIANACYRATPMVPPNVMLPSDTSGMISITFGAMQPGFRMETLPSPLRIHIAGPDRIVSATIDTMLLHTAAAFVEGGKARWTPLPKLPVTAAGIRPQERLIEEDDEKQPLRLLSEYFSFSKKFDFVDVDLAALARIAGDGAPITLHLAIRDVHPDSQAGQYLKTLTADNFQLFCTPIVNLFRLTSLPLKRHLETGDYPIIPLNTDTADGEVWAIDAVRALTKPGKSIDLQPFTSLMHGSANNLSGPYWALAQREVGERTADEDPVLTLVGLDGAITQTDIEQLTVDITYTNGNRPHSMPFGAAAGDLLSEDNATGAKILVLDAPTEMKPLPREGNAVWRLISQMTLHTSALTPAGLAELKRLLRQFVGQSSRHSALIDALKNLRHRPKKLWWQGEPQPCLMLGLEITLAVNEYAFTSGSLSALIGAMEPFFAQYLHENSAVELVVISANTGVEIRRCPARLGAMPLL